MTTLGIRLDNLEVTRFKNRFLATRQLFSPTGEPLYTYRTSSPEFVDLREGLRELILLIPKPLRLERIARARSWFPGLFVLYAAEWWRREYDGRGWTWEPIVESLGASQDEWGQAQRSICVEKGFDDWGISLTLAHGFRFLGSIALQGGLPMNLLAAAQGNIGRVLSRVLQLAASSSAAEGEIEDWVESLSSYLPFTYRQPEIYRLLSQVVITVLSLKRRANLISPDAAISRLDAFDMEWRNRFPLPIEDRQAQGLIEQLVKDAASSRSERTAAIAIVDRRLERSDDDWRFRTTLRISEYVQASELKRFFSLSDAAALPRLITLRLTVGSNTFDLSARRLAGRDCYRTDHRLMEFEGSDATSELSISLITTDGSTKETILRKGEPVDPEQPWVFGISDTDDTAIFLRQGGGSVASSAGLVCIKAQWQIQATDPSDECQFQGTACELGRDVYRFKGSITIKDTTGSIFKLRSSQAAADDEYLGWSGSRACDIIFDAPALAFRGVPKLCRFTEEGTSVSVNSSILWRIGTQRNTSAIGLHGPIEAIWPSSGELRWRSGLVLLGDAKAASATSDGQTNAGRLCFSGWNLIGVRSLLAEVEITNHVDGPTLIADFRYIGLGCPPEWCEAELLWRGNPNAARVRVPFPITGARAFDRKGRPLVQNAIISTENTYGVRLVGFLDQNNHVSLPLTVVDRLSKGENASFQVVGAPDTRRINIRLVD